MYKRSHFLFFLLFVFFIPVPIAAQESAYATSIPQSIDYIVAVVNEDVITRYELDEAIRLSAARLQQQGLPVPDFQTLENQVLELVITKRIQIQHAQEVGLSITEGELDETIARIAADNKLSLPEFHAVLENDGIRYSKFREEIRDEMIIARLKEREVRHQVNVTEGEVDNYLQTQQTGAGTGGQDEYRLAHIMILVAEHMDSSQIQLRSERAEMVAQKLSEGADFSQLATEYSDAADASNGGIIEWRPITQMGPTFAKMLESLNPGDVTPIIQSPNGFHIFKLLGRRAQEDPTVIIDQTHSRHILIKINELTSENEAKLKIQKIQAQLNNGEDFAELAKLYSEDSSASSGGDLGWLSPGDTVAEFEQTMNALLPGQISDPIKTQFGWHLIQVLERRSQDVSSNHRRQTARNAIQTKKSDVVIQEWLRQLRDQAYIEYRLDAEP